MDVRRKDKHEVIEKLRGRYLKGGRAEKGRAIDEVVVVTGYQRRYAQALLREGVPYDGPRVKRGGRPRTYGFDILPVLEVIAEATGWICGKRLAAALPTVVPALERERAITLTPALRAQILSLSAATIDRRLATLRRQHRPRGLTTTKPGSLLKSQIPIRTYTPWNEEAPGFLEIDLVAHCGTTTSGEYVNTLTATDIATGWTECAAIRNKSQISVVAALETLRGRVPFPIRGIDSDNGSEFINAHLLAYCTSHEFTFTRCRAYHKNDQAHVEEKNWSVVRQLIRYDRFEGEKATALLNHIYESHHLYFNGYLPVMKLVGKERDGARTRKHYDTPMTPFDRAKRAGALRGQSAADFTQLLALFGPLELRHRIDDEVAHLLPLRVRQAPMSLPYPA